MKLSYPRLGWAEVRWLPNEEVPLEVATAIMQLCVMPGVGYHSGPDWTQLDVPRNAWTVDAWRTVAHSGGTVAAMHYLIEEAEKWANKSRTELAVDALHAFAAHAGALWAPKQPLYEHQTKAARFLVENNGGLCADQMGLGKTREAIVAAQTLASLNGPTRPRVIIAPGYTRAVWRRELLAVGAIKDESELACAFTRDPHSDFDWSASWWFVHYDIAHWWQGYMATRRPVVVILDEVHWCKNGRAKRSKAAQAIAGTATSRILLTGTPLSNRPAELWWPLTILDGAQSWGGPAQFRTRYCGAHHDGYGLRDTGPTNVEELQTRLKSRYIRRTIEDAGVELPPLTRRPVYVPMDPKSVQKHAEVVSTIGVEKLLRAVLHGSAGDDTLKQITKLRKLTSKVKFATTVQLAADMLEQGESVVIFTWMRETADKIMHALDRTRALPLGWAIHGALPMNVRDAYVARFQDQRECPGEGKYIVATMGALREGVTLTAANNLILHDLDWVPANVLQAEARVYRIGQDKPTFITWMLAENSIDGMLATCLVEKSRVMKQTLGIGAASDAVDELGLPDFIGDVSVEAEVERLLTLGGL